MFSKRKPSTSEPKLSLEPGLDSGPTGSVSLPTPAEQDSKDQEALHGVHLVFNNELDEALTLFESKSSSDALYSLTKSSLGFFKAILTFDEEDIKKSISDLDKTYELAQADIDLSRPQTSILGSVSKLWSSGFGFLSRSSSSDSISNNGKSENDSAHGRPEENEQRMHNLEFRGHVIKAETLLLNALVQLFQESIINYMKAGLNLRKGYHEYQLVHAEMKKNKASKLSEHYDNNSVGGVYFGIGTTNVLLSILPSKILKIIAVLGIKGDRQLGFECLQRAIEGEGVRAPLAQLFVLMFHSLLVSFAPSFSLDSLDKMKVLLNNALTQYPSSSFFHLVSGRYLRAQRLLSASFEAFQKAAVCPPSWPELSSFSYYEIGLNKLFSLDWRGAIVEFDKLIDNGYWSKALFIYLKAACHIELNELDQANELLIQVESASQRKFGGRTISVEQFVLRKVKTYLKDPENGLLILPGLEIIAIWNGFSCMPQEYLIKAKQMVEDAFLKANKDVTYELADQRLSLLHFLKATILREIPSERQAAKDSFKWIFDHPKSVGEDTYIVPFALYEAGVLAFEENSIDTCRKYLESARDHSTDFNFEYRLAMRIHLALLKLDKDCPLIPSSN